MYKPLQYTFQGQARRVHSYETKGGETVQQLLIAGLGETLEVRLTNQAQLQEVNGLIGKSVEVSGEEERSDRFANRYYFGTIKEIK